MATRSSVSSRASGSDDGAQLVTGVSPRSTSGVFCAIAIANSAIQAIGCLGMRACHTNNCPVGIATQRSHLRARFQIEKSAQQLGNYLGATVDLMKVLARACGHRHLGDLTVHDITTWNADIAKLTGIQYAGVEAP